MSGRRRLFDLAGELVEDHESRSGGSTSLVVPIVADEAAEITPVVQAMCEVAGGLLLDTTSDKALQGPVPANPDPIVRGAVEHGLEIRRGTLTRKVVLADSAGLTDAVFDDAATSGVTPSDGEQAVLSLARAVIHERLPQHAFAAIIYSDLHMDAPARSASWSLIVDQLPGLALGAIRTLLVVSVGGLRIGVHCTPKRGCIYAIQGGRLLRRKPYDSLTGEAARLAALRDRPVVLFLGAGFSASSGMPLGNGLRDDAIRRLLGLPKHDPPLETSMELALRWRDKLRGDGRLSTNELAQSPEEYARNLTLEQVLRIEKEQLPQLPSLEEFKQTHDDRLRTPGSSVLDLVSMLADKRRLVLVAVNFDELIETHAAGAVRAFGTASEWEDAFDYVTRYLDGEDLAVPLLKLHGTISDFSSCVVASSQTELGIGEAKLETLRLLRGTETKPTPWYYIGASMRDIDLVPVLRHEEFARVLDEYWVAPYLEESVEQFAAARLPFWAGGHQLQERLVTESSDAFLKELASRWAAP